MVLIFAYTITDLLYLRDIIPELSDQFHLFRGQLPAEFDGNVIVFDNFNHLGDEYDISAHMLVNDEPIPRDSIKRVLTLVSSAYGGVEHGGMGGQYTKRVVKDWSENNIVDICTRFASGENLGLKNV